MVGRGHGHGILDGICRVAQTYLHGISGGR